MSIKNPKRVSKQYIEVHINVEEGDQEIFLANLMNLPLDSVWQKEDSVVLYFEEALLNPKVLEEIKSETALANYDLRLVKSEDKNWNRVWEESFDPITIDNFCYIRAEFHSDKTSCEHTITINPKMAFGTAHHPTTYMMMQSMSSLDFKDKRILDFGCGTGILAVLAEKLGSMDIVAIDYDEKAVSNTQEHIEINQSNHIQIAKADIPSLLEFGSFNTILANINRHVLLNSVTQLSQILQAGGFLLISGILNTDQELILETYQNNGFEYLSHLQREDWMCYTFRRI